MKRQVFKFFALLAVLAMAFAITSAAFAAPAPVPNASSVLNGNPGAIWTTDGDCGDESQDVNHYAIGDHVFINGSGFDEGDYDWEIKGQPGGASGDPGSVVASGTVTVGEDGSFCINAYIVADDDWGEYSVKVGNKGDNYNAGEKPQETASVSVEPGQCYWDGASYTDVVVTITGEGTLTITGPGGPFVRTGNDTLTLGPGSYSWTFVPAEGYELEGSGSGEFTIGECEPETEPASVNIETGACRWNEKDGSLTPVSITITGEGTLTITGPGGPYVLTASDEITLPPGSYSWTFVPAEGYHLDGLGSGSFDVLSCEPPGPGEASASLVPYCGGGIRVTVANSTIFVDSQEITENGSYALALGDYTAYAEADEGYEFPEGAVTQWEFSIEKCPTGHEEPPTGPLDSIPLSDALPIAGTALGGLGLLISSIIRRRR